jgi:hypothetical protein
VYAKLAVGGRRATIPPVIRLWTMPWSTIAAAGRVAIRWLSLHTGLPALVIGAILVVVGYRILKKTARFAVEVALVAALLVAATSAGWIQW